MCTGPSGYLGNHHATNIEGTPGAWMQPSCVRGLAGVHTETSGLREAKHPCPPAVAAVQGQGPGRWEKTLQLQHWAKFQAQPSGQTSGEGVTGRKHCAENGRGPSPNARRLATHFQSPGRHFSAADASRVLDQLQRDYERSLSRLVLDDIERLASHFLHPEVTEAMEKGFSK